MQRRRNVDVMVETLALEGKRVLDVGCGDGSLVRLMAKKGAQVLGVECSPRQLAKAHAAAKVASEEIVEGVGQALPAADSSFDAVVFFNALHHVPREVMGQALQEAARVLKPGGLLYVSEPIADGLFFETCRPVDDETEVRALAQAALQQVPGLERVEEITFLHTVAMADYAAFRERIISANAERESIFERLDGEMRALFARNARPAADGGFEFDQPMRVVVLRRLHS
jgi:2-polyprenyl-3-methyl-5-hydroxy-6-metoxy-1,4-benzoquinol methylase